MTPGYAFILLAERLADVAGAVIRSRFRVGIEVDEKSDRSPVTIADRDTEAAMRSVLATQARGHGVIGEELGCDNDQADYVWVLDPIDGTKAFIAGKPLFVTLIGLLYRGRPILGLIDQPVLGERWVGALGRPTRFHNGTVRVRPCEGLSRARMSTTSPEYFTPEGQRSFDRLAAKAKLVTYGGDGYQYGLVASGHLDLVVESRLAFHDMAALVPVVEGAGGVITDWQGQALHADSAGDVVAAGDARVHAEALEALR